MARSKPAMAAGMSPVAWSARARLKMCRVIVWKQPKRLAVAGNRLPPLLQLGVAASAVEVIGPGAGRLRDGPVEIRNRLGSATVAYQNLPEIVQRPRVAWLCLDSLLERPRLNPARHRGRTR